MASATQEGLVYTTHKSRPLSQFLSFFLLLTRESEGRREWLCVSQLVRDVDGCVGAGSGVQLSTSEKWVVVTCYSLRIFNPRHTKAYYNTPLPLHLPHRHRLSSSYSNDKQTELFSHVIVWWLHYCGRTICHNIL